MRDRQNVIACEDKGEIWEWLGLRDNDEKVKLSKSLISHFFSQKFMLISMYPGIQFSIEILDLEGAFIQGLPSWNLMWIQISWDLMKMHILN